MTVEHAQLGCEERREILNAILLEPDPTDGLWQAVDSGLAGELGPNCLLFAWNRTPSTVTRMS